MVEFEIFSTAYIIGGSLVAYQIGYVKIIIVKKHILI